MKAAHLSMAALLLGATPLAHAQSANITVTGKVLPGTCTTANVPVTLDDIDANDLKAGSLDNGQMPAVINFVDCVGVNTIGLKFSGTPDATQDGHWKNLASDGATGVAIALISEGRAVKDGASWSVAVDGAASAKSELTVGYFHKAGTLLMPGGVSTRITVTVDYR